nr:hypothetical protein [Tanacetum cinerariifolium]
MESDEVTESSAKNLLPILSECEVTLEDESKCDVPIFENSPICDDHFDIFSDSKINDDISVYDDDFKDIEYVEASLSNPEIVSVEEENDVNQEEEEIDLEDISQIQDIVLREKLLSITRLISNIESLNDNSTPDRDSNELFQKLLEDLNELAEYKESLDNSSKEIAISSSNPEKEEPPQDSDIHQLIEECSIQICEEHRQSMEDTMLELVKICQEKELLCIHDNVKDLIESAPNTKLLLINS